MDKLLRRLSGFARPTDFGCLGRNKPPRLRSNLLGLCTFVPTKVPKAPDKNYWRELHYID